MRVTSNTAKGSWAVASGRSEPPLPDIYAKALESLEIRGRDFLLSPIPANSSVRKIENVPWGVAYRNKLLISGPSGHHGVGNLLSITRYYIILENN